MVMHATRSLTLRNPSSSCTAVSSAFEEKEMEPIATLFELTMMCRLSPLRNTSFHFSFVQYAVSPAFRISCTHRCTDSQMLKSYICACVIGL